MNRPLYLTRLSRKQLGVLQTPLGERNLYDSAAYCNRCGSCAQVCPTYRLTPQETASPRGRNQVLRLALEGKLKLKATDSVLQEILRTCTLCGRCTQACPGAIPTAEHVLEMRRALRLRALPNALFFFFCLRETHPRLFKIFTHFVLFLRNRGLFRAARLFGLPRLLGMGWINRLDDLLPPHTSSVHRLLKKEKTNARPGSPSLIYLPSLEAEFILPQLALSTLRLVQQKHNVTVWFNTPTGLFSYLYGDLRQSRRTLRRLITRHAKTADGSQPLLTDSIDVYNFLKRAPQLFAQNPHWQQQAKHLADCVRFVTDIFPDKTSFDSGIASPVLLEYSAVLDRQSMPFKQAETILSTFFDKNLVECLYTDADVPAFGYAFTQGNRAEEIGLEAVEKIERTHVKTVFTLSGLSALELSYFLRRFYPAAQVKHLVDIIR